MIDIVGSGFVGMHLRHFELAGKERYVATHQFISHLDREVDGAGVSDSLIFAESIAAAAMLRLPPTTFLCLLRGTVEPPRGAAGHGELRIDLAAAGDWSVNAKLQCGHPTEDLKVFFVRTKREGVNLHRVFSDGRLVLRERVRGGKQ